MLFPISFINIVLNLFVFQILDGFTITVSQIFQLFLY